MTVLGLLLKRYLTYALLAVSLTGWCILASYKALFNPDKPIIIAIDGNGTRVVTGPLDPIFKSEVVRFLQTFLAGMFNFNADSFTRNVGDATNLMSERYWAENREKITGLRQTIEQAKLTFESKITRITKADDTHYQALLEVKEASRLHTRSYKLMVTLEVNPAQRTRLNPWGLEVNDVQETKLE